MTRFRPLTFSLLTCVVTLFLSAQSIRTIAGGGIDDGRPAGEATLSRLPAGVAVDGTGNIYVADQLRHRVRRIDATTGIITTVAGNGSPGFSGDGGPADEAQLNRPTGLALDPNGRLYIADYGNGRIRRVDPGRNRIETFAGNPDGVLDDGVDRLAARIGVSEAAGIVVAGSGDLYFADQAHHAVRRISASTGAVTTVAGTLVAGYDGDGVAMQKRLSSPVGLALGPSGNALVVSDRGNLRLRRVDLSSNQITTIAGDGTPGGDPDGTTGAEPLLRYVQAVRYDNNGVLHVAGYGDDDAGFVATLSDGLFHTVVGRAGAPAAADGSNPREVSLSKPQAIAFGAANQLYVLSEAILVETSPDRSSLQVRAGEASGAGDGGPAGAAALDAPADVAFLADRGVVIGGMSDVRRVDGTTGVIDTIAAPLGGAYGVDVDSQGRVYFPDSDTGRLMRAVPPGAPVVVAGGGEGLGDRVPALDAKLGEIASVAVAPDDSVYLGDAGRGAVFRYRPETRELERVAGLGNGDTGYTGDGGAAVDARIGRPGALAVGGDGTLFIADQGCNCVRRVHRSTGVIATIAGGGTSTGEDVPATSASFAGIQGLAADAVNDLWVSTPGDGKVRKLVAATGLVRTVAGGRVGDDGDGGPALGAAFSDVSGIDVLQDGSLIIADRLANRVRAVDACRDVEQPQLLAPAPNGVVDPSQVVLAWHAAGASLYDLYLKEEDGPDTLVASGLSEGVHAVRHLRSGRTYEWRVVAWGDAYCSPRKTASSPMGSFVTSPSCETPGHFQLAAPAPGQSIQGGDVTLSWTPSAGADRYEVFLGVTTPLVSVGTTRGTTLTIKDLAPSSIYLWSVRAYAACDASFSRTTDARDFGTSGSCETPNAPVLTSPGPSGTPVDPSRVTLSWTRVSGAAGYDVHLGRTGASARLLHNVTANTVTLSGLEDGVDYTWHVEAFAGCDLTKRAVSESGRFVTRGCTAPSRPVPVVPVARLVPTGRPYVVAWREEGEGDASRTFLVERSSDDFATVHDRQRVRGTSATFTATDEVAWTHRVTAVGCGGSKVSSVSPVMRIVSTRAMNDLRVLSWPRGIVVRQGAELLGHATSIALENPGGSPLDLSFVRSFADGTPFFEMVDVAGAAVTEFRMAAGQTRKFLVRFGGPSTAAPASFEGFVEIVRQDGLPLRSPVFAAVSLRIGTGDGVAPEILDAFGQPTRVATFPASADPAVQSSTFTIQVRNPGTAPLELSAETGPGAWIEPESGWNDTPIAPGASRTVRLRSRRDRAPVSATPRHTFLRFRSMSGAAATLLVVDPDGTPVRSGRSGESSSSALSYIVTRATSKSLGQTRTLATTLHLANLSADDTTIDLTFTPVSGANDPTVVTTSVVIPANGIATVIDPLVTWFGRARPATGQIEIRTAQDRFGTIAVSALEGVVQDGAATRAIPVVRHGEGAAPGLDRIAVLTELPTGIPSILLVETGGDDAVGRVEIADAGGVSLGSIDVSLPRNGERVLTGADFSLPSLAAPLQVVVSGSTGAIYPAILIESDDGAVVIGSEPSPAGGASKARQAAAEPAGSAIVLPYIVNGPVYAGATATMRTTMTFIASGSTTAQFRVRLLTANGVAGTANVTVEPRQPRGYGNVFFQLFGTSIERGALVVERLTGDGYVVATGIRDVGVFQRLSEIPVSGIGVERELESSTVVLHGVDQRLGSSEGHDWSLHLVETSGAAAKVNVSLFESIGPLTPLASRTVDLGALSRMEIGDLFEWIGLNDPARQGDRTGLLCVVSRVDGSGGLSASAVAVDRRSGVVQAHALNPGGGDGQARVASEVRTIRRDTRAHPVRR